jgi:DNA-binding MarR family transcriptional regulator
MKHQEFIASATEIRILLRILTKLAHQEFQEHLDACGVGISPPHYGVMRLLKHHPYTIKELSRHMLVEPASLVPVVDELERKTFVRRTTDPNDRRRTPLVLTEQGDQLLTDLPHLPDSSPFLKTLQGMGDAKIHDLLARLRELANGMSDNQELLAELTKTVRMQAGFKGDAADKRHTPVKNEKGVSK